MTSFTFLSPFPVINALCAILALVSLCMVPRIVVFLYKNDGRSSTTVPIIIMIGTGFMAFSILTVAKMYAG